MTRDVSRDVHLRFCANRNVATSLIFVAICAMEMFLGWRSLGGGHVAAHSTVHLLGDAAGILILGQFFTVFGCLRERIVLSLGIARLAAALIAGLAPGWVSPVAATMSQGSFALWTLAGIISLSMLVSASRGSWVGRRGD